MFTIEEFILKGFPAKELGCDGADDKICVFHFVYFYHAYTAAS